MTREYCCSLCVAACLQLAKQKFSIFRNRKLVESRHPKEKHQMSLLDSCQQFLLDAQRL